MKVLASIQLVKGKEIGAGQGQNSHVFLADDPQLGGVVALKEIDKTKLVNTVSSFFAEAQVMFSVAHANVVPIQYACETATHVCLVMPYYAAGSLAYRISSGPLSLGKLIALGDGVLTGLAQIHMKKYLHFDIKPTNVFYSTADVPLIADFGQARAIPKVGFVTMPPMYPTAIPPETMKVGVGIPASDVYQVGLLLYRAANGDPIYQAQKPPAHLRKAQVIAGKFPNRSMFLPHVPKRLRTIIRKALKVEPSERYQSAVDFQNDLAKVAFVNDWSTVPVATGGFEWLSTRDDGMKLRVQLLLDGSGWQVQVHTVGTTTRAKGLTSLWKKGLTQKDAFSHLTDVFQALE